MAKGQKGQLVTKKHLARQERERRQNRYILITSITVIVIVVGLIGYGIAQQYIIQPRQPVAKVLDQVITTKQFQTFARYERLQYIQQYQQYQQFAQMFGGDQSSQAYIQQYLDQISAALEPTVVGQNALKFLIENQFIQKEADKRGITVSDDELNVTLQKYFNYYPSGTPTPTETSIPIPTSTLNPTQYALVTSTPTTPPTATITPTPVITITATATPTPTTVITPTTPTPTSTPLPTATPYTLEGYQKSFQTYITDINSFAGLSESDFRWITRMQLLRQKVFDVITADVAREQDQVWARHIVVSDQTKAQSIYDRLTKGENFETVATEVYSGTVPSSPVDLGWFGLGTLPSTNAEDIVFKLQISQISEPIQTTNGWEIYQVLGHEIRPLTDTQYQQLKDTEFTKWLDAQNTPDNVQTFDIWKDRVPTSPTIPPTQAGQ